MCRYEDANAAFGPCARGDALQGVVRLRQGYGGQADCGWHGRDRRAPPVAAVAGRPPYQTLQGAAVQLFRVSGEGRPPDQHGVAAREDTRPPVFGTVM